MILGSIGLQHTAHDQHNMMSFWMAVCAPGVAMVLGVIWGGLLQLGGSDMSKGVSFAPEAFFFGLLPPIIYAAGFTLRHKASLQMVLSGGVSAWLPGFWGGPSIAF